MTSLGWTFEPSGHPVEYLSLSGKLGAQVRATVHSFGPLLLGKVLDLNDTQTSILSLVFKYCDDNDLPLLDLKDLAATLKYLASDDGKPILADYGGMSRASVGVLLRSIVVLEQEGADVFFGEPEFDVADLLRTTPEGEGIVSILELSDVMDKPRLFSTFMLWMLAQLYETLPEVGDLPKPKLCFFFDEAHLLFDDASQALLDEIERTARLIRSKGVGVYFVTQAPTDVPSSVLAQLGNRVQHALRAFTPDDADALRKTARTFPTTTFYDVEKTITSLGTGEALVTVLSPRGVPTPLAATRLAAARFARWRRSTPVQFQGRIATSPFAAKYGTTIDRDSAYERITARIAAATRGRRRRRPPMPPSGPASTRRPRPGSTDDAGPAAARDQPPGEGDGRGPEGGRARAQGAGEGRSATPRKAQQRTIDTAHPDRRQGVTSRLGQDVIRGVFGTLFGGGSADDRGPAGGGADWRHGPGSTRRGRPSTRLGRDASWPRSVARSRGRSSSRTCGRGRRRSASRPTAASPGSRRAAPGRRTKGRCWRCSARGTSSASSCPGRPPRAAVAPVRRRRTDPARRRGRTGDGDHDLGAWERILPEYAALQRSRRGRRRRRRDARRGRPGRAARGADRGAGAAPRRRRGVGPADARGDGRRAPSPARRLRRALPAIAAARRRAGRASASPPSIQHDDLHGANIMVGPAGDRFFDWGDAVVGAPVRDAQRHVQLDRPQDRPPARRSGLRSAARRLSRGMDRRSRRARTSCAPPRSRATSAASTARSSWERAVMGLERGRDGRLRRLGRRLADGARRSARRSDLGRAPLLDDEVRRQVRPGPGRRASGRPSCRPGSSTTARLRNQLRLAGMTYHGARRSTSCVRASSKAAW